MPANDMLHPTKKKKVLLHLYLPICTHVFGLLFHRWGFFVCCLEGFFIFSYLCLERNAVLMRRHSPKPELCVED